MSRQFTTEAGPAQRNFARKGTSACDGNRRQSTQRFTRMAEVADESCCSTSSSWSSTSLKATKART